MAIDKNSIPYAKALFDLAVEKKNTANIKADLVMFKTSCKDSEEFRDFISNPTITHSKKLEILQQIFGGKVQKETLDFLALLVKKGRLGQLSSICEACIEFINRSEDLIQVKLTSATALSDNDKAQIASKFLGKSKYEMENVVNPDIIGGFILEYDNKILDNSVSNQLQTLKNNLSK